MFLVCSQAIVIIFRNKVQTIWPPTKIIKFASKPVPCPLQDLYPWRRPGSRRAC